MKNTILILLTIACLGLTGCYRHDDSRETYYKEKSVDHDRNYTPPAPSAQEIAEFRNFQEFQQFRRYQAMKESMGVQSVPEAPMTQAKNTNAPPK